MVLLDEPTASLDPQGTQRIEELLFELKREFTIIIVTHNMQQAARVSDTTTFFYLGTHGRVGPDPADLHRAAERADRGLHHREVRMTTTATPRAQPGFMPTPARHAGAAAARAARRASGGAPAVDVRDFSFAYGSRQVLRNLTFAIERKAVTAIIGPSGCGKSTFLRSINRLNDLIPGIRHEGDILVEGTLGLLAGHRPRGAAAAGRAWCSSGPIRSPSRSSTTSPTARRSTGWSTAPRPARPGRAVPPPGGAVGRGEGPARGARRPACRAASSSGSASPARSATSPRCC